jgi:histidyl-tRNA synthetase
METLKAGLNFTLTTDLGWIDLFGEISGGGRYEELVSHAVKAEAFGVSCRVLDLETLIRTKRFAGRPKDLEAIAELESLGERLQR